jgi:hypothetical protein
VEETSDFEKLEIDQSILLNLEEMDRLIRSA